MPDGAQLKQSKKIFYRRWRLVGCLVFVLFLTLPGNAERLPFKIYTTEDGLPQNQINKITQDATGFFWFCTEGGLARFDGYNFRNFTTAEGLPSDKVKDFIVTRSGDYWLATTGGLVKFTPEGTIYDRVVTIDEASEFAQAPAFITFPLPEIKNKTVTKLLEDRHGTIWVGASEGLFKLEKFDDKYVINPVDFDLSDENGSRYIFSLYEDRSGAIWIGTESRIFRISDGGRVTNYTTNESPPVYFRTMLEDGSGNFWVGTLKKGLFQFTVDENGSPQPLRQLTTQGDGINWIEAMNESFDGKLWLGSSDGLYEFDPAASKFYRYTRQSGIGSSYFQSIFEDKSGNLWLGTRANGVFRFMHRGLVSFGIEDDIAFIWSVSGISGGSLFLTGFLANKDVGQKGARVEVKDKEENFEHFLWRIGKMDETGLHWTRPVLPSYVNYFGAGGHQTGFQARSGEWWIATGQGVFRYPKVDFEKLSVTKPITVLDKKYGLVPQDVYQIYEDSRGNVWFSTGDETGRGFYCWRRDTETLVNVKNIEGLPSAGNDLISSFAEDNAGNIWIGYLNRGFARITGDKARFFDSADGVPQGGANDIFADREGKIWIASGREGIAHIDDPASINPHIVKISKKEGLSTNRTFAVTQDLQGLIYIATDRDINRLNPVSGEIKVLKISDNQPQAEFHSAFCDTKGVLWFGTTAGLIKYVPLPENIINSAEVLLTGIEIKGKPQKISLTGATRLYLPTLTASENQVKIDFISLAALDDENVRYQYKLESATDWSQLTDERFVNFAELAAGDYKILIRASDNGIVSEKPALVAFTILPPIYLRWWFVCSLITLIGFVIYSIYRSRLKRFLEIERVRTRITTDLHDDIGANLTRIALLSEVANQQTGGNGNRKNLLPSIADIARESVDSMNDIVWAISPKHDRLLDLTRRMRQHAEEIFTYRDIDLEFNAPPFDTNLKLSVGVRRDLLLIFKEAVNNAARHSGCSRVEIDFCVENSSLNLRIADNGCGFDDSPKSDGQGLRSMSRRAAFLGGKFKIDSSRTSGTSIEFELSLQKSKRT